MVSFSIGRFAAEIARPVGLPVEDPSVADDQADDTSVPAAVDVPLQHRVHALEPLG